MDKLSVIIPIYNVEPYIRQCLDSVINQTYKNLEIILIDDGSPDNCGAICDEYAQKDDRIVVIHKQNGGVGAARNDGIKRATGEWVTFVDPDDWCELEYYKRMSDEMIDSVDIFCSGGCFREYGNETIECHAFTDSVLFEGREQTDFLMAKTLAAKKGDPANINIYSSGAVWDKLFNRSFLLQNQLRFDTTLHPMEDLLFNFLAFDKADRVATCSYIGYHYRQQVATSSGGRFNPRMPDMCTMTTNWLNDYMIHREPNESIQNAIHAETIKGFARSARCYFFHKDNLNPYKFTVAEISKLKHEPAFSDAIHSSNNQYLTRNQLILKYLLRLPWVWPLKLAYGVKQMLLG